MVWAEFEEKQFETASNIELSERRSTALGAGQVAEALLGYDLASHPHSAHRVWSLLEAPRPPGVRLLPIHWRGGGRPNVPALPRSPISLLLQYKRPEFLQGANAKQWRFWERPYFRFRIEPKQQKVLKRLERALGEDALVRYASPAFWTQGELEVAHRQRSVVASTGFIQPSALTRHKVWTYVEPGIDGRANPKGTKRPFVTLENMLSEVLRPGSGNLPDLSPERRLSGHVDLLARAAREEEPEVRRAVDTWLASARERSRLPTEILEHLRNLASIGTLLHRQNITWIVVDRNEA